MKNLLLISSTLVLSALLAACSDDDDPTPTAQIRAIHAVPDAPPVNIKLNGNAAVTTLDYAENSGFATARAGTYDIAVEAIIPGGNLDVITVNDADLTQGTQTTVFAVGTVDSGDADALEALVVPEPTNEPASNEVVIKVVHAAPVADAVDIYVTAPGAALAGETPIDANYKASAELPAPVAVGNYQVRITEDGNAANVLYDSGSIDFTPFAGQKLLVAAMNTSNATEAAASPVKLVAINNTTQVEILDTDTQTGAKVVHLSPDAGTAVGAVEVFANDVVELIDSFEYADVVADASTYALVDAGTYDFDVSDDDDVNDPPAANFSLDGAELAAGAETTVIAVGYVATSPEFDLIASADENRAYATHARVKVIHGAAAVGDVDVYVAPAGDFSTADINAGNGPNALLEDFSFKSDSGYVDVAADAYDIFVVDAVSETVAIEANNVAIGTGDVLTVIARGPDGDGTPGSAGLLVLTN